MNLRIFVIIFSIAFLAFSSAVSKPRISHYDLRFTFDFDKKKLFCDVRLTLTDFKQTDTLNVLLYRMLKIKSVKDESGQAIRFKQTITSFSDWDELQVNSVEILLNSLSQTPSIVHLEYEGHLFGYTETGMNYVKDNIDRNFTLIRPDCYAYPVQEFTSWKKNKEAETLYFDYTITAQVPAGLRVINGGKLVSEKKVGDLTEYTYVNIKPAWRIDIAIGKYSTISSKDFYIHHFTEDSAGANQVMHYLRNAIDYYTAWMGAAQTDGYAVIEIPDTWGSQTDVTCILQEASAFRNKRNLYELYHEISHIWNVAQTDKFPCRLQSEGLAVFFQYLMMEKLHGRNGLLDSVAQRTFLRLKSKFAKDSLSAATPIIEYGSQGLTDLSYTKGMLFFYLLHKTMGEDNFMEVLKQYRTAYRSGSSTQEFIHSLVSKSKSRKVRKLVDDWVLTNESSRQILASANVQALLP